MQNKAYVDFRNLHVRDQTEVCVHTNNSNHITFTDCTFASTVAPLTFIDVTKNRNSSFIDYTRCHIYESLGIITVDGFEFWDCDDCTCTDCTAVDLRNGASALDNGHGFEVYGESAAESCSNIQFIRCYSDNCRVGFSVEAPNDNAAHTVILTDCTSGTHDFFDYHCEAPGSLTINGHDGGSTGGDGTIILN